MPPKVHKKGKQGKPKYRRKKNEDKTTTTVDSHKEETDREVPLLVTEETVEPELVLKEAYDVFRREPLREEDIPEHLRSPHIVVLINGIAADLPIPSLAEEKFQATDPGILSEAVSFGIRHMRNPNFKESPASKEKA